MRSTFKIRHIVASPLETLSKAPVSIMFIPLLRLYVAPTVQKGVAVRSKLKPYAPRRGLGVFQGVT